MRANPNIYDTEEAHNEIGQAIHDAKRRLLDSHRKGVPLNDAAATFYAECENVFTRAAAQLQTQSCASPLETARTAPDAIEERIEQITKQAPVMNDDQISELTGRLQRTVDAGLRRMAEAIRRGASPDDAFMEVCRGLIDNAKDVPRAEYDGMTHTEWWADKHKRAEAIINDESGRYADSTKAAITLVHTEMKTPGNEKETDIGPREYGEWIKRAESGEVLDVAELIDQDEDTETESDHKPKERELYEFDEDTGVRTLRPYGGREGIDEIERLAKACLQNGEEDQHLAVLELLTHLMGHDGSGWAMYARGAIVSNSTELSDRAADLLVADAQRKRGVEAPALRKAGESQ